MADKIKQFFKQKKVDKQFKKAGPGHKLSESESSASSSGVTGPDPIQVQSRAGPSAEASKAGAAALARLGGSKDVDWSKAAIRAQALKELELEQQAAVTKSRKEELAPQSKETPPQLGCQGLLFRCPMLGPQALPKNELEDELKTFLFEQLAEEKGLSAALIIVTCNSDQASVKSCVDILSRYLTNIIANPDEDKYRKIKLSNKAFQEKVKPIIGSREFLEAAGFVEQTLDDGETYLVHQKTNDLDLLPALRDALTNAEPLDIVLDRNVKVLLPSDGQCQNFSVPDEFFMVTAEEVAREQAERTRDAELRQQLRTKAMRDRDSKRENICYKYSLIRVRLPNGYMLQGTFEVTEKLSDVYQFVKDCLNDSCSNQVLRSGVETLNEYDKTLQELKLLPAVVVNCTLEAPPDTQIIRSELMISVETI